jgi:XTP/dITP diphosphohydrolase
VTIADDSGLEVDALGGMPGIYSARFAGEPADDSRNNEKLLAELARVPDEKRGAQFTCVLAIVDGRGREKVVEGVCRGVIIRSPKNSISHRCRAIQELKKILREFID